MKTTTQEKLAFIAIAFGLLITGLMDGQDHKMAQKYAATQKGQQMACIHCGGQP